MLHLQLLNNMELTINVNENEAQLILAGLAELPAKHSIDLILKLKNSFEDQIKAEKNIDEGN
jgi:hypothetical protein